MSNFHQAMVNQLMHSYHESAIVRIKWGEDFCEHIKNHRLVHCVSKMEVLPLEDYVIILLVHRSMIILAVVIVGPIALIN